MARIVGIDPEVVIVTVQIRRQRPERLAHVVRHVEAGAQAIDAVANHRIGAHLREIADRLIGPGVDVLPRLAAVDAAIDTAIAGIELPRGGAFPRPRPTSGGQSTALPPPPGNTAPATSTSAYNSFGSTGDMLSPMRPLSTDGMPFVSLRQVSPPSVDL